MESNNPQMMKVLQNGAKLVEHQRKETSVDWSTIDFTALPLQENVTWWLRLTDLADGGTSMAPARSMLECMTYGNTIDAARLVDKYRTAPTSEDLLQYDPAFYSSIASKKHPQFYSSMHGQTSPRF